jgi:hypothetical protein
MNQTEQTFRAPSRHLSAACQGSVQAGQGNPFTTAAERVVRKGNPIHRQAGVLIKQILACVLFASPFALLVALRLGGRHLEPHYLMLALGAVVVLVLLIIVPIVANRQEDTPRGRTLEQDAAREKRSGQARNVQRPADLP